MKQRKQEQQDKTHQEKEKSSTSETKTKSKKAKAATSSRSATILGVTVLVTVLSSLIIYHQVLQQSVGTPKGTIETVGFFGQRVHLYCLQPKTSSKSKPLVVFHHGIGGSSLDWYDLQQQLNNDGISSCSYDRPGYGYSSAPVVDSANSLDKHTESLHQLLSKVQFSSAIHVGHSLGGAIALSYVLKYANNSEASNVLLLDPQGIPNYDKTSEINTLIPYAAFLSRFGILRIISMVKRVGASPATFSQNNIYDNVVLQDKSIAMTAEEISLLPFFSDSLKYQISQSSAKISLGWISSTIPDTTLLGMTESIWKKYSQSVKQKKQELSKILKKGKKVIEYELKDTSHQQMPFSSEMGEILHDFIQETQL